MRFWDGRRVLVTGHTGFKGAWLCEWLLAQGAQVHGLSLAPDTTPALFDQLGLAGRMDHALGDIRDPGVVADRVMAVRPQAVLHLAAQPLVRRSYREPLETFATNVMGTAHLLQALRALSPEAPLPVVVVTTDKVYENREWLHGYREGDALGGHDPYSASKAAAEIVAASFARSFFGDGPIRMATARAGNVIGGGDWSEDRFVPDAMRALANGQPLAVRNPAAVRPWQHVMDPLAGYLRLAERLAGGTPPAERAFNFGPDATGQRSVGDLLSGLQRHAPLPWTDASDPAALHEAGRLALSTDLARQVLDWRPRWDFDRAVAETAGWYRDLAAGGDALALTRAQIAAFEATA